MNARDSLNAIIETLDNEQMEVVEKMLILLKETTDSLNNKLMDYIHRVCTGTMTMRQIKEELDALWKEAGN